MESPVVVDKPPEYGNSDHERGFPFDEEEAGAWSNLAARHPDIAARLRARPQPQTWARKRRPSAHDAQGDFGFERFPFEDIPPEFRDHFPSHWNRRFAPDEQQPSQSQPQAQAQSPPPQQQPQPQPQPTRVTISTQTDPPPEERIPPQEHLPQYGLRNTVDLGQKSPADPSLVDADDRNQRSMSAPPDHSETMSGHTPSHESTQSAHSNEQGNVRHIPIFVEGRDEPVINRAPPQFADAKPTYQPHPPPPEREQYFPEDVNFHHPPNFSRAFGTPFNKGFRQGPQPFTQQKAYPQTAFGRASSPGAQHAPHRAQSPKPHEEHYVKVPVHHEPPKTEAQPSKQPPPPPQRAQTPQQHQQPPQQQAPPPKPQPPPSNDPITQILAVQTDVLNLMTDVENFTGTKKDKRYIYLDEMLTRNLIKLDTIETDGKENIRQARKEAIRCIQKCIAVLEAKAEKNASEGAVAAPSDFDMENSQGATEKTENGEVEMKENAKEGNGQQAESQTNEIQNQPEQPNETQAADTRPETAHNDTKPEDQPAAESDKKTGKKKVGKKRDKSKDKNQAETSNKDGENKQAEPMQVDDKGEKVTQAMEVDAAAASQ